MNSPTVQFQGQTSQSTECLDDRTSIFQQLRDFRRKVPKNLLIEWEKPTGYLTFTIIAKDWGIIAVSHQIHARYPSVITFMAAIFLMSWGQMGLRNLSHDSIHSNLVIGKKWNDVIANVFLAPASMITAALQRKSHTAHHHYLGTTEDPDHGVNNATSLKHYRTGRVDHTSILSLFLYDVLDPVLWFQSALGSIFEAPLLLTTWWLAVTVLAGFSEPKSLKVGFIPLGWQFIFLYHTTRCTLSHIFYVLRETIDHSGLQPATVLGFTRTSPCCNAFQKFLQPHDDCYHLLHHLLPRIPMTKLHESHEWLVENCDVYEKANRYTTYFGDDNALFAEIVSRVDAGLGPEEVNSGNIEREKRILSQERTPC